MKTTTTPTANAGHKHKPLLLPEKYSDLQNYYNVAGPDYEMWSKNFNMHFGYCRQFSDMFFLEKMLQQMNDVVMNELQIDPLQKKCIADLGCGVGTVARQIAKKYPLAHITGITIVDYQIEKGNELIVKDGLQKQVMIVKNNFESLSFCNETFDYAYAIESSCHASGQDKAFFVAEMARVLKPGGRFCIADGFIKHDGKLPSFFSYLYNKIKKYWALPCFASLHQFQNKLSEHGFKNITVREISYRIAPSVAYVPWTCLKFFAHEIWSNKSLRLKKERWYNVYGPVLGMILGLYRKHFGYYIIIGEKA
jgi:MPBQ/MSBQ methyltransferase